MLINLLKDSWSFFKKNVISISLIVLPITAPLYIFTALSEYYFVTEESEFSVYILFTILDIAIYPLYSIGVVYYIASVISGQNINIKKLWRLGVKFWLSYLIMSILVGVCVIFGFVLLIIPGIIIAVRYAFTEFDLLLNQSKPLDAMGNSWHATKEYMWVILGGYVIITTALYVPLYLVSSLIDESNLFCWALNTLLSIVYTVFDFLYTIFAFRVYDIAVLQNNQSLSSETASGAD